MNIVVKGTSEALVRAGREMGAKARADVQARRDWSSREVGQAAKEIASHIANKARDKKYFFAK